MELVTLLIKTPHSPVSSLVCSWTTSPIPNLMSWGGGSYGENTWGADNGEWMGFPRLWTWQSSPEPATPADTIYRELLIRHPVCTEGDIPRDRQADCIVPDIFNEKLTVVNTAITSLCVYISSSQYSTVNFNSFLLQTWQQDRWANRFSVAPGQGWRRVAASVPSTRTPAACRPVNHRPLP